MARIVESVAGDKRLRLQGESFMRRMSINADWTKIRIGLQVTTDSQAITSGGLLVGLTAGLVGWEDANVNFVGYHFGGTIFASSFSYNAGPPAYNTWPSGACGRGVSKVGASITSVADAGYQRSISAAPAVRSAMFVDITRGSPNYTVQAWWQQTGDVTDRSGYLYFTMLEYEVNVPVYIGAPGNAMAVAYSGSAALDTVLIRWQNTLPGLEICQFNILRFR